MQGCQVAVESMQAERRASLVLAQCAQYADGCGYGCGHECGCGWGLGHLRIAIEGLSQL